MEEKTQPEKLLERILARNPDMLMKNTRGIGEDLFLIITRALIKESDVEELFMSSHTPLKSPYDDDDPRTRYRLWIKDPSDIAERCGHPNWDHKSAVIEAYKKISKYTPHCDADIKFYDEIIGTSLAFVNHRAKYREFGIRTGWIIENRPGPHNYCNESRIYRLK